MKKEKFGLALFSAAVLLAVLVMAFQTAPEPAPPSPVAIQAGTEQVKVWRSDEETYVAFLPGHISLDQAVAIPVQEAAALDGNALPPSGSFLEPDRTYALTWEEGGEARQGTLQILSPAGLPTLYLDTQSGSMDHIHAEKGNAERGALRLYDAQGTLNFSGTFAALRGRGNSTWDIPEKKPYALDLTDEADLLGMGSGKHWILLADAMDASALRNRIAYGFAAKIGMEYAPDTRWTEVYLNGEYAGLYLLCERIENEPGRLDLGQAGVLLRMDRDSRIIAERNPYFVTDAGLYLQIMDGRDSAALQDRFQQMEDALLGEQGDWQQHIDLDSWVRQYLMEEVFGSYDAGFLSQNFYLYDLAPESRIYAGPVWDYDSSMGNPGVWALQSPRGLFAGRPEVMDGYATPWYYSLYGQKIFYRELVRQYRTLFLPELEHLLTRTLEDYTEEIGPAFERNRLRWRVETEGLEAEAAYIRTWLRERMAFLNDLWLEEAEFNLVRVRDDSGYYNYYALEPGSFLQDLPHMADEGYPVWYRVDTGEAWDLSAPVLEDLELDTKIRTEEPEDSQAGGSLKELLLTGYLYVPAAVLVLMGVAAVPVALWKNRSRKEQKQKSTV